MTDLTKWPRLLVTGKPVTVEQADEILVRTNNWFLMSNDRQFTRAVYEVCGIAISGESAFARDLAYPDNDSLRAFQESVGALSVDYLANHQVVSSWIGGPHGWCDWAGNIGCSTYNIGKWPDLEEVHKDWLLIAAAFPYLDLRAQLVPNEGEAPHPAAEWVVRDGEANLVESIGLLAQPTDAPMTSLFRRGGERGVSLSRLQAAVERTRAAVGG